MSDERCIHEITGTVYCTTCGGDVPVYTDADRIATIQARATVAEDALAAARAEVATLRGALRVHGVHAVNCAWRLQFDETSCNCGLAAALAGRGAAA